MPKKILLIIAFLCTLNVAFANDFYEQGMRYMNSYQYSSAISQFRNAIRQNPSDYESRIELINAYSQRAAYHFNVAKDYQKALNDSRSALFYLKYFADGAVNASLQSALASTEKNVKEISSRLNPNPTPEGLLSTAKQLRNQSELPASFIVYQQLIGTKYDAEASIASGDILKVLKNPQRAIAYYNKVLNSNPNNYDILIKVGECYQEIGDTKSAAETFNKALTVSKNSDLALDKLEETWRKQIYATPSDSAAHTNLGVIYQKRGDYDLALKEYQKAEQLNPKDTNNTLNLGTLYQEQKKYDMAIATYDKVLFSDANNLSARKYKAECLKQLGKDELALIEYQRIMALSSNENGVKEEVLQLASKAENPDTVLNSLTENAKSDEEKAVTNYKLAYQMHTDKKFEEAKKYYLSAKELGFKDADLYLNLSDVCLQLKQNDEAIAFLKTGHDLYPANIQISDKLKNMQLANSQKIIEQANQAMLNSEYNKALTLYKSIQPQTADSLVGIASTYQAMDKIPEAIEYYKKASQLAANDVEIMSYIASAYVVAGDYNNARIYANKVLALKPNDQNAKNLIEYIKEEESQSVVEKALNLYNSNEYQKAYDLLTNFISKNPQSSYGYYYRGMVLDAQKKYNLAISDYVNAIKYDAKFDLAYYGLAVDYDMSKNYKEAYKNYKKYLQVTEEQNEYTEFTKKRIGELEKYVPNIAQVK